MYLFSAKTFAFYPLTEKQTYIDAGTLPDDVIEVEDDVRNEFNFTPPVGKMRGVGPDGMPAWVDMPPPTHEQLVALSDAKKTALINAANAVMNSKQWPGKAVLGRLKAEELAQYNLWLDYLDALEAVDTSTAPDITWPIPPAA